MTRLILNAHGSAFQKLQLHQAELLADNDPKHVRRVVELLGGQWGRIALEKQHHDAEQALFHSAQQPDESNDSFIARCDILWNRLLARKMTLEDLQSYIVLRGSLLSADEKKKVILDSDQSLEGKLTIKKVTEAIRVLGATFFGEMVGSKKQIRSKVYDQATLTAEAMESGDLPESALVSQGSMEPEDEDQMLAEMMREGDTDAALIADFEGAASELLQEDEELAAAYTAYEDARRRLAEKYRNRGFWPVNRGPKGKSKGKRRWDGDSAFTPSSKGDSWYDKNANQRKKTLQDRILQSNCRLCGRRGHWKAECPERHKGSTASSVAGASIAPTSLVMVESVPQTSTDQSLPLEFLQLPEMQTLDDARASFGESFVFWCSGDEIDNLSVLKRRLQGHRERLFMGKTSEDHIRSETIRARLSSRSQVKAEPMPSRYHPTHDTGVQSMPYPLKAEETICFATHGSLGIVDLGASKTVIGSQNVSEFLHHLKPAIRDKIARCPCAITFRFGNQGTLKSSQALVIPVGQMLLKVAVVPGETPFLLSNTLMRALKAQIDCSKQMLQSPMLKHGVKLTLTSRGLFLLDVNELIDATSEFDLRCQKAGKPIETFLAVEKTESHSCEQSTERSQVRESQVRSGPVDSTLPVSKKINDHVHQHVVGSSVSVRKLIDQFEGKPPQRNVALSAPSSDPTDGSSSGGGHLAPDTGESKDRGDSVRTSPCWQDVSRCVGTGPRVGKLHHQPLSDKQQDGAQEVPSFCGTQDSATRSSTGTGASGSPRCYAADSTADNGSQWQVKRSSQSQRIATSKQGQGIFNNWRIQSHSNQRTSRCPPGTQLERFRRRRGSDFRAVLPGRDYGDGSSGAHGADSDNGDGSHGKPSTSSRECPESSDPTPGTPSREFNRTVDPKNVIGDTCLTDLDGKHEEPTSWSPDRERLNSLIRAMTVELEQAVQSVRPSGNRAMLFEVFCSENSSLTEQVQRCGQKAKRFGLAQGDLSTIEGRANLFMQLAKDRPRHLWVSPDCGPWSSWTRLNESLSCDHVQHYQQERTQKMFQIALGIVLYRFQKHSRGHFHWEQPSGSSMLSSPLVSEIHEQTQVSRFDMCNAGQLVDPLTKTPMKKGMHVLTSSQQLYQTLHGRTCRRNHVHQAIEGTTRTKHGSILRTKFTEKYPRKFARLVAHSMCRPSVRDPPLSECCLSEILTASQTESAPVPAPRQTIRSELLSFEEFYPLTLHPTKRRRLGMKQTVSSGDQQGQDGHALLQKVNNVLPRVGKRSIQDPEIFQEIQSLFPEKQIVEVIACRGTDRTLGPPKNVTRETGPYRRSIILHRQDGKVYVEKNWEHWKNLAQRQIIRPAHACRINITVFGANHTQKADSSKPKERPAEIADQPAAQEGSARMLPPMLEHAPESQSAPSQSTERQSDETSEVEKPAMIGGIMNRMSVLSQAEKNMIMKVHSNLGHPSNERLSKALREAGYRADIAQAALDLTCPNCSACSHPKQQRPATLRPYLDFNHRLLLDGIKWTNSEGKSFHFYHMLDAGSNYHVATCAPSRTSESLLEILGRSWLSWAGSPLEMLVDSATEMNSTEFQNAMHRLNIRCTTICPEAHWQNGKIERHGGFLQEMLQRVDKEIPIKKL